MDSEVLLKILAILPLGIVVAFFIYKHKRPSEKQKASLDFIKRYTDDSRYDKALKILENNKPPFDDINDEAQFLINFLLNTFEDLAIGIDHQIYDKKMIEKSLGADISKIYKRITPYIEHSREKYNDPDNWKEFEKLVGKIKTVSDTKIN